MFALHSTSMDGHCGQPMTVLVSLACVSIGVAGRFITKTQDHCGCINNSVTTNSALLISC